VDTHANHLAQQANDKEKKMSDTYGLTSFEPLASYDPDTHSWKMYAVISLWGLTESLQTLPKSGMTRNGRLFQQPVSARLIDATELSVWPTPRVTGSGEDIAKIQERFRNGLQYKQRLEEAVALWPTPTAHPDNSNLNGKFKNPTLGDAVRMWPTPTHGKMAGGTGAFNKVQALYSDGKISDEERKSMQAGNGGKLNPTWVEWLMGFPLGWTDLED
jgi:DNA (cytosine-5)-methyltransferase 1